MAGWMPVGAADNWNIPAEDFSWVINNFMADRAAIAWRHSKPIVMEEFGVAKVRCRNVICCHEEFAVRNARGKCT